jgi:3-deoxy-D-manno-octulosonate 8-phosphate phosphatase (KDO 8-P phosphatase)
MLIDEKLKNENEQLQSKIEKIKIVVTDIDGVLTDAGVYFSAEGEELKRFSIRDGMGVERLRKLSDIETIIVTGEISGSVRTRASKLKITEYYLGVDDKVKVIEEIKRKNHVDEENIAFIGDDVNDISMMEVVGFTGTPADGTVFIKDIADYICTNRSGNGAFREFAELIIAFTATKN